MLTPEQSTAAAEAILDLTDRYRRPISVGHLHGAVQELTALTISVVDMARLILAGVNYIEVFEVGGRVTDTINYYVAYKGYDDDEALDLYNRLHVAAGGQRLGSTHSQLCGHLTALLALGRAEATGVADAAPELH